MQKMNVKGVSLHADPSRTAALNLFCKLGFQLEELIEQNYYGSGFAHVEHGIIPNVGDFGYIHQLDTHFSVFVRYILRYVCTHSYTRLCESVMSQDKTL
ncbi:hypothetical protein Sjap_025626 [Stephania japonica]|uniref:Uncharacterized protein n=1 Tax=Stephania japonica TaxID=461633 RepID=A0AAP0HJQ9_9MAGN